MLRYLVPSLLCVFLTPLVIQVQSDYDFFVPAIPCSSDDDCDDVKDHSRCANNAFVDGEGNNITGTFCGCKTKHDWVMNTNKTMCVKKIPANHVCHDDDSSECADPGSECVDDGSLSNTRRCMCKVGWLLVQKTNPQGGLYTCGMGLSDTQDSNCTTCISNDGRCYDLDGDFRRDGCQCKLSQTGPDCEKVHLQVTCTGEVKTICYGPAQAGVDFDGGSRMYADGKADNVACVGKVLTNATATSTCPAGYNLLVLPLTADKRDRCGTVDIADNGHQRLETMITLTRADNLHAYNFKTYCEFQSLAMKRTESVGVIAVQGHVVAAAGNDRGQTLRPVLSLTVLNSHEKPMGDHPKVLTGDKVFFKLELQMTDPPIYTAIRAKTCMTSTDGSIDLGINSNNNGNTQVLIQEGCPEEGQTQITSTNTFMPGAMGKLNMLQTGKVPLVKLPGKDTVFFHCTVQLCTPSNIDQCAPTDCDGKQIGYGRRKRAATSVESGDEATITTDITFVEEGDGAENSALGGSGSIVGMTTTGFVGTVVVMVAVLIAFVVLALYLLWRVKNKEAKVMDHQPGKPQNFALPRMERNQNI